MNDLRSDCPRFGADGRGGERVCQGGHRERWIGSSGNSRKRDGADECS